MPVQQLSELLDRHKADLFVGREEEKRLFEAALEEPDWSFHLLFVCGPAGMGKSSLLNVYAERARSRGVKVMRLPSERITPTVEGVLAGFEQALMDATERSGDPAGDQRFVLMIDDYDKLQSLDDWFREIFFPRLPITCLVVLGCSKLPGTNWRSSLAWAAEMRIVELESLSFLAMNEYLSKRGIGPRHQPRLHSLTRGHPLALTLAADAVLRCPERPVDFSRDPEIGRALGEALLPECSPLERSAIEAAAILRVTTEESLAALVDSDDTSALFKWLADQDFMLHGPRGLHPAEPVRSMLRAQIAWRSPASLHRLRSRADEFCRRQLVEQRCPESVLNWAFLHRIEHPFLRHFMVWSDMGCLSIDRATPSEEGHVVELALAHEGPASADLARRYFNDKTCATFVCRRDHDPAGVMQIVEVAPDRALANDECQAVQAARRVAANARGNVLVVRTIVAADSYQDDSPVMTALTLQSCQQLMYHPEAVRLLLVCSNPRPWEAHLSVAELTRVAGGDYSLDDLQFRMLCYDHSRIPIQCLIGVCDTEHGDARSPSPPGACGSDVPSATQESMEPREAFEAVRRALRDLHYPAGLAGNPLLTTGIVRELSCHSSKPALQVEALRLALTEAIAALASNPRKSNLHDAVRLTYLEPVGSQEKVAEKLDLPMSTFRRHLREGITAVAALLLTGTTDVAMKRE